MLTANVIEKKCNDNREVLLKAVHISKVYGSGSEKFHAVRNIDLEIYKGDFTVIMGSSGSGKSTLLYMLSGLDNLTHGEIYFKDRRIDSYSEVDMASFRAHKIGYVYQSINLVPDLTLYENITFPGYVAGNNKTEVRKKASSLMKLMDIERLKKRFPSQVSGGQQQRAAIARSLISTPEVIFADEPTGALNFEQGNNILNILTNVNKLGQSIVMVTHDLKAACRADRLILIKDGMVEGILELSKYKPENLKEREMRIYSFVSRKE
ncbi:ABC transporter ATP-binding protein [Chengkuizengella sediminis]|uniref:ABC transporter ATP-binding protein n=1 Tax=Chengkuizengella sediminis TaxID=1885917 RepID=UPI00138952DD|nr:ABC transporter ATP-binding protein [Chengkuizengella sediminis]NDI35235.1 ABC transporter ATP-binding protein [Chengkuizengella sediminis]